VEAVKDREDGSIRYYTAFSGLDTSPSYYFNRRSRDDAIAAAKTELTEYFDCPIQFEVVDR
jgi:hypothetical protein